MVQVTKTIRETETVFGAVFSGHSIVSTMPQPQGISEVTQIKNLSTNNMYADYSNGLSLSLSFIRPNPRAKFRGAPQGILRHRLHATMGPVLEAMYSGCNETTVEYSM